MMTKVTRSDSLATILTRDLVTLLQMRILKALTSIYKSQMSIKYPIIYKKQDQIQMRFQVLVSLC